jgi:hypothetical protein
VRIGGQPKAPVYVLADDCYASHWGSESHSVENAILVLEDGAVAVFRGKPPDTDPESPAGRAHSPRIGPVYASDPGGNLAVPTGRILVRFAAGTLAEDRRADLRGLGLDVEEVLAYAPEAAWVRHAGGGIVAALRGLAVLESLPGVEHVEPQMLMKRARRKLG